MAPPYAQREPSAAPASAAPASPARDRPAPLQRPPPPLQLPPPPGRFAYVTLLSDERYLPGVRALARSARLHRLAHPLIVMATESVSPAAAARLAAEEGLEVRRVPRFLPAGVDHSQYVRALYAECWNKLRMWEWEASSADCALGRPVEAENVPETNQTTHQHSFPSLQTLLSLPPFPPLFQEFDRLVYLDADMALARNVDALFRLPHAGALWAVADCFGGRETAAERAACCFFRPDAGRAGALAATSDYFNAGFFVVRPRRAELAEMEAALAAGRIAVGRFSEQDFLNGFFAGRWVSSAASLVGQAKQKTSWKPTDQPTNQPTNQPTTH